MSQTLVLSYAYHCCDYMPLIAAEDGGWGEAAPGGPAGGAGGDADAEDEGGFSDEVLALPPHVDLQRWANGTDFWASYRESSPRGSPDGREVCRGRVIEDDREI